MQYIVVDKKMPVHFINKTQIRQKKIIIVSELEFLYNLKPQCWKNKYTSCLFSISNDGKLNYDIMNMSFKFL